jgi:DNA-directed RNA polymerase subunit RPC12/RpoP
MTDSPKHKSSFGCPHCSSVRISENNVVGVRLRVTEWDEDGEPASFAYPWHIKDDTMTTDDENPRYYCDDCGQEFEEPASLHEPPIPEALRGSAE